jgi:glycosyltransferase involved in cell wall biosynthesis
MHIGIASPILVEPFKKYLNNVNEENIQLGLGGTSVNHIITGLLDLGHSVSVYTLDFNVKRNNPIFLEGEKLKIFIGQFRRFSNFGKLKSLDFLKFESNQIKNFILIDKPEIVNAHWSYEYAIGAIRAGYPHVITFRDNSKNILKITKDFYRLIRLIMDFWVRKKGECFTVNSPYLRNSIKIKNKTLFLIPNPIAPNFTEGKPKRIENKTIEIYSILNNGNSKIKNPKAGIKAFQILQEYYPEKEFKYHLFGSGLESDSEIHKWSVKNKLDINVSFHGYVEYNKLMSIITIYDIMLHPSLEESFGNTLLEAMLQGIPIVAGTESGAVPWVLNYGENGILVNVLDPHNIFLGLKNIIDNDDLYLNLSKNGIKYVIQKFSYKSIAQQYINLFHKNLDIKNFHSEVKANQNE